MTQVAPVDAEVLQDALDLLNGRKFRELSLRAGNIGMSLLFLLEPNDPAEFDLGTVTLPVHERLAAIEELIAENESL